MFKGLITDVFFDLDHTLWDFEKNSELTFQKIFKEYSVKADLDQFLEAYVPINLQFWKLYREEKIAKDELRYQRLKQSFDAISVKVSDELIFLLSEAYIKNLSTHNHIFPGTIEILDYLRPNYKLHIITNGFAEIQEKKMINANIRDYFDVIINSEMAGVKKPNSLIFELGLEKANVKASNSIMIGDNLEADILGAQKLGFHALHFNSNNEKEHNFCRIINHLNEIKHFL